MSKNYNAEILKVLALVFFLFSVLSSTNYIQENPTCAYCKKEIKGQYIIANGKYYHPGHFLCAKCNKPITGEFVSKDGKFYHKECFAVENHMICDYCQKEISGEYVIVINKKYHTYCYENYVLEKCSVCGLPLQGNYIIDIYGNKYHPAHETEFNKCDCCNRLICEKLTGGGRVYSDGRNVCNKCYATAVSDQKQFEKLLDYVEDKIISLGIPVGKERIKIIGVDRSTLRSVCKQYTDKTRGYCVSSLQEELLNGKVVKKIFNHTIYVLYGMSAAYTKSTIAHELMHAWIYENTKNRFPDHICEGACNYVSYLFMNSLQDMDFYDVLLSLEKDRDPVYGDGFRYIKSKFLNKNVKEFLQYLINY